MAQTDRRKLNGRKPDPRKDKLAYFADNIQNDEEDFDPKMYYYHRPEKEIVNSSVLSDPQGTPSRYSFASQSPPPGIFSGHTSIPSMHSVPPQSSAQQQPSMGVRGPPSMSNLSVQSSSPVVVSQPPGRGEMLRYGTPPSSMPPMGHSMQGMTSMASAARAMPQMTSSAPSMPRGAAVPSRMSTMSPQQNIAVQPPQQTQPPQRSSHGHIMTGVQSSQLPVRQMSPLIPSNPQMNMPPNYNPSNDLLHMINRAGISGGSSGVHGIPSSSYPSATSSMGAVQDTKENLAFDINEFPVLGLKEQLGGAHKPIQKQTAQTPSQQLQSQKELRLSHDEFPTLPSVGYKSALGSDSMPGMGTSLSHPSQELGDPMSNIIGMNPPYQVHPQQNYPHMVSQAPSSQATAMRIARPGSASSSSTFPPQYDQQPYMSLQQTRHPQLPQQQPPSQQPSQQKQQQQKSASSVPDRWGLLGLLSVIRMTDPDLNTLALGTDLTTLGLNLNSPDCLYAAFSSPFADGPSRQEPDFHLPLCYYMQPPMQPPELKVTLFSEETLFYIFYSMPRDFLQIAASVELNNRDWRYHKEHQLWFTRVPGTEPLVKTSTYERGSYIFFDSNIWDKTRKDNFMIYYDKIAEVPKIAPSSTPAVTPPASQVLKALV